MNTLSKYNAVCVLVQKHVLYTTVYCILLYMHTYPWIKYLSIRQSTKLLVKALLQQFFFQNLCSSPFLAFIHWLHPLLSIVQISQLGVSIYQDSVSLSLPNDGRFHLFKKKNANLGQSPFFRGLEMLDESTHLDRKAPTIFSPHL